MEMLPIVKQLETRGGNPAMNQFDIAWNGNSIFQSYESKICIINHTENIITLGRYWDCSRTTYMYLYQFLSDHMLGDLAGVKNVRQAIYDGYFHTKWCKYKVVYSERLV